MDHLTCMNLLSRRKITCGSRASRSVWWPLYMAHGPCIPKEINFAHLFSWLCLWIGDQGSGFLKASRKLVRIVVVGTDLDTKRYQSKFISFYLFVILLEFIISILNSQLDLIKLIFNMIQLKTLLEFWILSFSYQPTCN